jgi:AraC-like DNA-binding protein
VLQERTKEQYTAIYRNALEYIARNYSNPELTAEEFMEVVRISRSTLERAFSEANDKWSEAVIRKRMTTAAAYLRETNWSVEKIAHKCGYRPVYFSPEFKKRYEMTPTQYRIACA